MRRGPWRSATIFTRAPIPFSQSKRPTYLASSGFDLPTFVDGAFKKLTSDVALTSTVTIGQYTTELTYSQPGVNTTTDQSLNLLLPILAQPIVQKIVDGSGLG